MFDTKVLRPFQKIHLEAIIDAMMFLEKSSLHTAGSDPAFPPGRAGNVDMVDVV